MADELGYARDHFYSAIQDTLGAMRDMQGTPFGTEPRPDRQRKRLMKELKNLPPDLFNAAMNEYAVRSGHQTGESYPCDACKTVIDLAGPQ